MFLNKVALAALALSLFANSFPISEETYQTGLEKRVAQKPLSALAPGAGTKQILFNGKHLKAESYRAGTDIAPWTSNPVLDVMLKWKEDSKQMHGPYIAVKGKSEMVNQWTGKEEQLLLEGKRHSAILFDILANSLDS